MLDDRQKKVLKTYEKKGFGNIEVGDIEGFDEVKDFSSIDFTLALAKLNPFYAKQYNFKRFTKAYANKLVDAGKIFFADRISDGFYRYKDSEIVETSKYDEDWTAFSDMVKEKTAMRVAWAMDRKKVDAKYERKDKNLSR